LDGLEYRAGRADGVRWRADGNGIVHGIEADLQGDPLDRPPRAIFGFDPASCALAGEARLPARAWVLETRPDGDKPAFLYVDAATGTIVREVMRDGKRVVTTMFDQFEPAGGALRARHWRIDDGDPADTIDATVESIEPDVVTAADVGFPARRTFAPPSPERSADLDAAFHGGRVEVAVQIDGRRRWFDLDCGTTSITVDPSVVKPFGGPTLEHAVLPVLSAGPLRLDRVSVLTVPFEGSGILGLDFFFGHVIEVDYVHRRVRVLADADARAVFGDPKTAILDMNVDQGLPLVHAGFGPAQSNAFAVDTGSPRLHVMAPFVARFSDEVAKHWTPAGVPFIEHYLEGGIELRPYRVASFQFANASARDLIVGAQVPTTLTDDLRVPFDGIIGTDILRNFDLYFDYDNARLGLRR
jgi:hypothetical protein